MVLNVWDYVIIILKIFKLYLSKLYYSCYAIVLFIYKPPFKSPPRKKPPGERPPFLIIGLIFCIWRC